MADAQRLICASAALIDGGKGVRFTLERRVHRLPRLSSATTAGCTPTLNRCAHIPIELDWLEGEFFDKCLVILNLFDASVQPMTPRPVIASWGRAKGST